MINKDERDTAFLLNNLPVNPIPFLNRMNEIMNNSNDHSFIHTKEFKSNLLIILTMIYGYTELDITDEYYKLEKEYEKQG